MNLLRWYSLCVLLLGCVVAEAAPPTCIDPRLVLEMIARDPDIVTPTGVAVDEAGSVWVIENHTHQRPDSYKGPTSDRVRIFADFDEQGKARKVTTFADGFRDAMSLILGRDGAVYLATRRDVYRMRDKKGTGTADEREVIVKLDSPGNYPHNGLSGFAFDALGNLYFSLGENLGATYALIGSDKTTLRGGGEGGSIYRCRPDGTGLIRVATGFWNTFHIAFDAFGRLLAVDNDPDSRGPCRLLHIVQGGDYGYRYRNGRKGLHPFTAWNGELPGTLPMVAGTAEAPSGIVVYEGRGLPAEYRGQALVTSWGDHVIERFPLLPRGASLQAEAKVLVRGGDDFRPVGIVSAPDGSLVFSDWVDKSYPVHGKGRLWRLRWKDAPPDDGVSLARVARLSAEELGPLLGHPRVEVRQAAADRLAGLGGETREVLTGVLRTSKDVRARMHALWAGAQLQPTVVRILQIALVDEAPEVRAEAARLLGSAGASPSRPAEAESVLLRLAREDRAPWVRLQALAQLRADTSLQATVPVLADQDPFLAGTILDVLGRHGKTALLVPHAKASEARLRLGVLLALRRAGEAEGQALLPAFLDDPDPGVRRAAIQWVGEERLQKYAEQMRTSAAKPPATRDLLEALLASDALLTSNKPGNESAGQDLIARIVADPSQPKTFRALGLRMLRPEHKTLKVPLLQKFLTDDDAELRREAARVLVLRPDGEAQEVLRGLAASAKTERQLRAEAVMGLGQSAVSSSATQQLLVRLLSEGDLTREALRSLRGAVQLPEVEASLLAWSGEPAEKNREVTEQLWLALRNSKSPAVVKRLPEWSKGAGKRPESVSGWRTDLQGAGDPATGERVFYHAQGPRCYSCHQVDGRGAAIGPDLSTIGSALSREKLIDSILEPSKEIAPRFTTWRITTKDGKTRSGIIVNEGFDSTVTLADNTGKLEVLRRLDIEERIALPESLMPANLPELLSRQDFLDLLAFLASRK